MTKSTTALLLLLLALIAPAAAQTVEDLKSDFARESQLLDQAIDDFGRSRVQERQAIDDLQQLARQLDAALEDPNASLDRLNRLEAQVAAARDRACTSLELTSQARRRIYDRMERLAAVARQFESQSELFERTGDGLEGMWHLEIRPLDIFGLMHLRVSGSQVSGPYRLSNGRRGSLSGSLAGNRLNLRAVDSDLGVIGDFDAVVDLGAGTLEGSWTTMNLSAGLPSRGAWLADKISSSEEIDLEE